MPGSMPGGIPPGPPGPLGGMNVLKPPADGVSHGASVVRCVSAGKLGARVRENSSTDIGGVGAYLGLPTDATKFAPFSGFLSW